MFVHFNEERNLIYADYNGKIPKDSSGILGFIPPLGPLAETEEFLNNSYIRASINTSIAPRHLRNHLAQILSNVEYAMVQKIVEETWPSIKLLDYEHHLDDNTLSCFFREGRIDRELAWAGQGLQVWFQIITHLIRLRDTSILILDEPEVNLHAEKQNDLIQVLKDYHKGSVIIATHSVELMNNVDVSHIVHVQKKAKKPIVKETSDRLYLDQVRSQVGSDFNLIASQFETFDLMLYTESGIDFKIIQSLAVGFKLKSNVFNVPLHGFSEYPKALNYRDAYKLLIGKDIKHIVLLDRDYYPEKYLEEVKKELKEKGVSVLFTPGKEIENLFLSRDVLNAVVPAEHHDEFDFYWDKIFEDQRLDAFGSYLTLHKQFLSPRIDTKTITTQFAPQFEIIWNDKNERHRIIQGKKALQHLRNFYQEKTGINLTTQVLIEAVVSCHDNNVKMFLERVFGK